MMFGCFILIGWILKEGVRGEGCLWRLIGGEMGRRGSEFDMLGYIEGDS